jgi:hypothetical protein
MTEIQTKSRELPRTLRPAQAAPVRRSADLTSSQATGTVGCQASCSFVHLPFASGDAE